MNEKPQILLTNDDGIGSPGLWAAAEALSTVGFVNVIAPRDQQSGTGRSLPVSSDGVIQTQKIQVKDQPWTVFAVGGTPAQAVLHGVLEIMPRRPDLVVAGINYGENVGTGVTISGTVGAALEAAAHGIPALAISLETEDHYHLTHSPEIDFKAAGFFAAYFGRLMLALVMPPDVEVLKVEVPASATPETPWRVTKLARSGYYESLPPQRTSWEAPGALRYRQARSAGEFPPDTDVYTLGVARMVSVTPLSLDLTSRVDLNALDKSLRMSG